VVVFIGCSAMERGIPVVLDGWLGLSCSSVRGEERTVRWVRTAEDRSQEHQYQSKL
jgi:hypothetical protein